MAALESFEQQVLRVERWLLVAGLAVMVVTNVALILSRPLRFARFGAYFDLMVGIMPWVAMIGMSVAMRGNRHIGFVAFVNAMPRRVQKGARAVAGAATVAFLVILLWGGIALVRTQMSSGLSTSGLGLPAWWISLSVPVGASLTLFHLIVGLIGTSTRGPSEGPQALDAAGSST